MLEQHRIETGLAKRLPEEMPATIGIEQAQSIPARTWRMPSPADYPGAVLPLGANALKVEVVRAKAGQCDLHVRRRRRTGMHGALVLAELGWLPSCNHDGAFCETTPPA